MGTNEENIIENLVCFIYGGAGAGSQSLSRSQTFAPAPAPTKKYRLRLSNTACAQQNIFMFNLVASQLKYPTDIHIFPPRVSHTAASALPVIMFLLGYKWTAVFLFLTFGLQFFRAVQRRDFKYARLWSITGFLELKRTYRKLTHTITRLRSTIGMNIFCRLCLLLGTTYRACATRPEV